MRYTPVLPCTPVAEGAHDSFWPHWIDVKRCSPSAAAVSSGVLRSVQRRSKVPVMMRSVQRRSKVPVVLPVDAAAQGVLASLSIPDYLGWSEADSCARLRAQPSLSLSACSDCPRMCRGPLLIDAGVQYGLPVSLCNRGERREGKRAAKKIIENGFEALGSPSNPPEASLQCWQHSRMRASKLSTPT